MTKLKSLTGVGLLFLTILALSLSVFLAQPSEATSSRNQEMIQLNLIDEVRTPANLGLDYLQQEPIQLTAGLIDSIRYAEARVAQLPEDFKIAFDLGTNSPIQIGDLPDESRLTRSGYEAVGYINSSGQVKAFTPILLGAMFDTEANNRGQLVITPEAQEILVADASGAFLQARRMPSIDLIVHPKGTNEIVLIPRANANAVCRDALNAVLNETLRRVDSGMRRPRRRDFLW